MAQPDLECVMLLRLALILLPLPEAGVMGGFNVSAFKHCSSPRSNHLDEGQEKNNLKE